MSLVSVIARSCEAWRFAIGTTAVDGARIESTLGFFPLKPA